MMMLAFTVQFSRYGRSLRPCHRVPQPSATRDSLVPSGKAVRRDAGPDRGSRRIISRRYPAGGVSQSVRPVHPVRGTLSRNPGLRVPGRNVTRRMRGEHDQPCDPVRRRTRARSLRAQQRARPGHRQRSIVPPTGAGVLHGTRTRCRPNNQCSTSEPPPRDSRPSNGSGRARPNGWRARCSLERR
jgi:hypothetical protein